LNTTVLLASGVYYYALAIFQDDHIGLGKRHRGEQD